LSFLIVYNDTKIRCGAGLKNGEIAELMVQIKDKKIKMS